MPALTRRRSPDAPDECWHVYYGDVRVGTIALRTGMPPGEDPGAGPAASMPAPIRENAPTAPRPRSTGPALISRRRGGCSCRTGGRPIFRRGATSGIGRRVSMRCGNEAKRMPTQRPGSLMRCPCGEIFNSHLLEHTLIHVPHVTAAQAANGI